MNDIGIRLGLEGVAAFGRDLSTAEAKGKASGTRISNSFRGAGNALQGVASQVPGLGSAFTAIVNPITAASAAIIGIGVAFKNSVNTAADFEKQLSVVASVSDNVQPGTEAFQQLVDVAKELGATTEFSATQAAEGLEFLARAGFSVQESVDALPQTLALATAGQLDLARATDLATDIAGQFGIEAENLGRVVDTLAKTAATSNTDVNQLGDAFNYLGPTANALGVSIEEAAAQVGILANAGLKGSLATRALGTSLVRVADPPAKAAAAIERLGLSLFDAEGNFVGITDTIRQLETAFVGLDDQQQQAALSSIFGAEAIQEFNILLNAGADELEAYEKQIRSASETNGEFANSVREQQLDNVRGSLLNLSSAYEALQIAIAEGSLPAIKGFINTAADAVRAIAGLIDGSRSLESVFGERLGTAIRGVFDALDGVSDSFQRLVESIFGGSAGFETLADVVAGALTGGFEVWGFALEATFEALSLVVDIITEVISFLGDIGRAFLRAGNVIGEFVLEIAELFGLGDEVREIANAVSNFFSDIVSGAGKAIRPLDLIKAAFDGLRGAVSAAFAFVSTVIDNFVSNLSSRATAIADIFEGIINRDASQILSGLSSAVETLPSVFEGAGQAAADAFNAPFERRTRNNFADTIKGLEGDFDDLEEALSSGATLVIDTGGAKQEVSSVQDAINLTKTLAERGASFEVEVQYPSEEQPIIQGELSGNAFVAAFNSKIASVDSSEAGRAVAVSLRNELNNQLRDGGIDQATFNALNSALTERIEGAVGSLDDLGEAAETATSKLRELGITPEQIASIDSLGESLQATKRQLDLGSVRIDFEGVVREIEGTNQGILSLQTSLESIETPEGLEQVQAQAVALKSDLEAVIQATQDAPEGSVFTDIGAQAQNLFPVIKSVEARLNSIDIESPEGLEELRAELAQIDTSGLLQAQEAAQGLDAQLITATSSITGLGTQGNESLDLLGNQLSTLQEALKLADPESTIAAVLATQVETLEGRIESTQRKLELLGKGFDPDPIVIPVEAVIEDIDLSEDVALDPITIPLAVPDTDPLTVVANELGLSLDFINQNFETTEQLTAALGSSLAQLGADFGLSTEQALEFSRAAQGLSQDAIKLALDLGSTAQGAIDFASAWEDVKGQVSQSILNGVADSAITLGEELAKVSQGTQTFAGAMAAAFQTLLQTLLVEVPKLLGLFLLQSAVGLGFPAGIPFAVGGLALLAFSGFASGLLNSLGGKQAGLSQVAQPDLPTRAPSTNGVQVAQSIPAGQLPGTGLGSVQQVPINNTVQVYLDGEEVTGTVLNNIAQQNQRRGL